MDNQQDCKEKKTVTLHHSSTEYDQTVHNRSRQLLGALLQVVEDDNLLVTEDNRDVRSSRERGW